MKQFFLIAGAAVALSACGGKGEVAENGSLGVAGVPATLVTAYLHERGVEVEKTTDFTILFLFSIGITKGKWGTLLNALLDFKTHYELNAPLIDVMPKLAAAHPGRYGAMGLRDLASEMFEQLKESRQTHWLAEAFSTPPVPVLPPRDAYALMPYSHATHWIQPRPSWRA